MVGCKHGSSGNRRGRGVNERMRSEVQNMGYSGERHVREDGPHRSLTRMVDEVRLGRTQQT